MVALDVIRVVVLLCVMDVVRVVVLHLVVDVVAPRRSVPLPDQQRCTQCKNNKGVATSRILHERGVSGHRPQGRLQPGLIRGISIRREDHAT